MTPPAPGAPDLLQVVAATAATLGDPTLIGASPDGRSRPQSLAGGAAGIALLHIERALSGHGDAATAHTWLRAATSEPVSAGPNADLFHGAPSLAFVVHTASPLHASYHRALTLLDGATVTITRTRLDAAQTRIDRGDPLPMREFDLVHGLTGLGIYHLLAHPGHPITHDVVTYLARLTAPAGGPTARPPWWLSCGLAGTPDADLPDGHGNLGLAHGISAVIAVLSLALQHGHASSPAEDALAALCAWTDQYRQDDDPTGPWWPGYVTPDPGQRQRHRPSWCYGTAGVARAQQLAGLALRDTQRQRHAEHAMLAVLTDPAQRSRLPEAGLCHGKAGLLQSACRMAAASTGTHRTAQLTAHVTDLAGELATQLVSEPTTDPELMNGAAGAALALHTAATGAPTTRWDAFLALA